MGSLQYLTPINKNNAFSDSNAVLSNKILLSKNELKECGRSYINLEYRRVLSNSTKDVTTTLSSPKEHLCQLQPSHSCPNPLYMLSIDDVEALHPMSDSVNKVN